MLEVLDILAKLNLGCVTCVTNLTYGKTSTNHLDVKDSTGKNIRITINSEVLNEKESSDKKANKKSSQKSKENN